ncbi:MAG: AAA family ATPase [Pseudomonadota bacterium]
MSNAQHILALLRSHINGDDEQFCTIALQIAAHQAKLGHSKLAQELKDLIEVARSKKNVISLKTKSSVPITQPKGDLSGLLSVRYSDLLLDNLVVSETVHERLERIVLEYQKQDAIRSHGLDPRRKILIYGPPGSGKSMTALALAGQLNLPLFTIQLDGLITKFMGETASKLRFIFEAISNTKGVYFFDEFDAIGTTRNKDNDVGEVRRILNSFLQFLELDNSTSMIIAATNHIEILDKALFRRFDDVLEYKLPDKNEIKEIISIRLATFTPDNIDWASLQKKCSGLSHAEITRIVDNSVKDAILSEKTTITLESLSRSIEERKRAQPQTS